MFYRESMLGKTYEQTRSAQISSVEILWGLDPARGGIAAAVPSLSAALCDEGRVVAKVVGFTPDAGSRAGLHQVNHNTYTLPSGRLRWLCESRLKAQLRRLATGSSVLHIHGLWQEHGLAAAAIARSLALPYVVSAHGMLRPQALETKRWKKELYSALFERPNLARASVLRAITDSELSDYRRFGSKTPVVVIPNGVTIPGHSSPQRFWEHFPGLANQRIVLFMGRVHPHKGVDLLIRAWSRIAGRFADTSLVVVGPDELGAQAGLVQLASDLAIANRVRFAGMLKGELKWSALSAAELLVLPSRSEGLSLAVLEAMACAKPVIVTQECNFPEVESQGAGVIIKRDDVSIEKALMDMLTMSARDREAIGTRGRGLVQSKYSLASVARSMADCYQWLSCGGVPNSLEIHYC